MPELGREISDDDVTKIEIKKGLTWEVKHLFNHFIFFYKQKQIHRVASKKKPEILDWNEKSNLEFSNELVLMSPCL